MTSWGCRSVSLGHADEKERQRRTQSGRITTTGRTDDASVMTSGEKTSAQKQNAIPVCVGFSTSLAFWLAAPFQGRAYVRPINKQLEIADVKGTRAELGRVNFAAVEPPGVRGVGRHVLASSRARNGKGNDVVWHLWPRTAPAGSFYWAGGNLCVASPALTVVMTAQYLTVQETAEVVCALYGSYAIDAEGKIVRRNSPLLTPEGLDAYLRSLPDGFFGLKKARAAWGIARPGAESPREAAICVVARSDSRAGGGGLRRLELNHEAPVTGKASEFVRSKSLRFDGFIPRRHGQRRDVGYEFDSVTYHAGVYYRFGTGAPGEQIAQAQVLNARDVINHDSHRRSAAWELGVDLVTFTTDDVSDADMFFSKVDELRRMCGMHELPADKASFKRRRELHRSMLANMRFSLRMEERLDRAMQVDAHHREASQKCWLHKGAWIDVDGVQAQVWQKIVFQMERPCEPELRRMLAREGELEN